MSSAARTKAIVTEADPVAPRITTAFLAYAQARGFVVDTTRVRRPKDKARVERVGRATMKRGWAC